MGCRAVHMRSYMDEVLSRRLGLPITLSVLYAVVCRSVDIPIEMIGMVCPLHAPHDALQYAVIICVCLVPFVCCSRPSSSSSMPHPRPAESL